MQAIQDKLNKYDPLYITYISQFSKAYLQGSPFYVGDSLNEWWMKCGKVYEFKKNLKKLRGICEFLDEVYYEFFEGTRDDVRDADDDVSNA